MSKKQISFVASSLLGNPHIPGISMGAKATKEVPQEAPLGIIKVRMNTQQFGNLKPKNGLQLMRVGYTRSFRVHTGSSHSQLLIFKKNRESRPIMMIISRTTAYLLSTKLVAQQVDRVVGTAWSILYFVIRRLPIISLLALWGSLRSFSGLRPPLISSNSNFTFKVGNKYARLTDEKNEVVITRFFGIFFLFFQSSQIWGSLISSLVLSSGLEIGSEISEDALGTCGINFCPSDLTDANSTNENLNRPSDYKINSLVSIFLISGLLAPVIIACFVDPLSSLTVSAVDSPDGKSGRSLLFATFQNMRHPYQLLIIPLTIFSGIEQAFLGADFTAAYVSCGLGIHMVGYIFICYGIFATAFSLCLSPLVNRIGRIPIFTAAALINLGICITFLTWMPHPNDIVIFFVIAALWGVADAVWQIQINVLYGVIFPGATEAAFSNYRLWECIGYAITFICSGVICITSKIVILFVFLVLGMLGYYFIEVIEKLGGLKKDENGDTIPIDKRLLEIIYELK
ncbi:unnamed protein product, partial [Meganyctiphanes norvegica]